MANNDSTRGSDSEPGPSTATADVIADSTSNPLPLEIDWNVGYSPLAGVIWTKRRQTTDNDSAYGDEVYNQQSRLPDGVLTCHSSTYTSSITSSVMDFPEIEGRRYHAYRQGRTFAMMDAINSTIDRY